VDLAHLPADLPPVLLGREPKRGAHQMNHAGLHVRGRPHRTNGIGQTFEPVAAHDEGVGDAPVAELGEHGHPELGALPAAGGAHPQAQDVPLAVRLTPMTTYTGRLATWPSRILTMMASINNTG